MEGSDYKLDVFKEAFLAKLQECRRFQSFYQSLRRDEREIDKSKVVEDALHVELDEMADLYIRVLRDVRGDVDAVSEVFVSVKGFFHSDTSGNFPFWSLYNLFMERFSQKVASGYSDAASVEDAKDVYMGYVGRVLRESGVAESAEVEDSLVIKLRELTCRVATETVLGTKYIEGALKDAQLDSKSIFSLSQAQVAVDGILNFGEQSPPLLGVTDGTQKSVKRIIYNVEHPRETAE